MHSKPPDQYDSRNEQLNCAPVSRTESIDRAIDPIDDTVPAGAPRWITPALIKHTILAWQPYYETTLTPDDALTMILGVGRLYDVLSGDSGT